MVKVIGAVMTGFACGYFGFRLSMALKTRVKSLADIRTSLEMLESEINFSVNKLKKAFMRVDRNGLFTAAAEAMEEKGAKTAERVPMQTETAPSRILRHASKRSPAESIECSTAILSR